MTKYDINETTSDEKESVSIWAKLFTTVFILIGIYLLSYFTLDNGVQAKLENEFENHGIIMDGNEYFITEFNWKSADSIMPESVLLDSEADSRTMLWSDFNTELKDPKNSELNDSSSLMTRAIGKSSTAYVSTIFTILPFGLLLVLVLFCVGKLLEIRNKPAKEN